MYKHGKLSPCFVSKRLFFQARFFINEIVINVLLDVRRGTSNGAGKTFAAITPRKLTARHAESNHISMQSTTPHYYEIATNFVKTAFLEKKIQFPQFDKNGGGMDNKIHT
ncbi:hypothetical protein WQ54_03170 [Bacillus sp. SA1-12]|nr:hypothetical protein WQ54_03170 [Bacillus sp. SA1-12]